MTCETDAYDVLILGGGPSGLSTAMHLIQLRPDLAPRILVLERAHYPRPKLCAGGLVADAEIILRGLGLDASEVPHVDADAAHFDFAGRGLRVRMRRAHTLRIVRRDEFDAWLAREAARRGIKIREGVTVRKVKAGEGSVVVETDRGIFSAQVVVGADGSNGITRRAVLPDAPVSTARVLEVLTPERDDIAGSREATRSQSPLRQGQIPTALSASRDHIHERRAAYFDFSPVPDGIAGYTWDFPTQVNGQPMRCWGIYDTNLLADLARPPLKAPLREEMARLGLKLDDYELKGHPIRWFDPLQRLSTQRVILVGDAAGADPLFGEGISMALGYGKVAAREVVEAFSRGDFQFAGYRRRLLLSPLGQTLVARWLLGHLVYSFRWAWFQSLVWRVFKPLVLLVAWLFVLNWGKRLK
jgi:flavin-dependent dehydrogenase